MLADRLRRVAYTPGRAYTFSRRGHLLPAAATTADAAQAEPFLDHRLGEAVYEARINEVDLRVIRLQLQPGREARAGHRERVAAVTAVRGAPEKRRELAGDPLRIAVGLRHLDARVTH